MGRSVDERRAFSTGRSRRQKSRRPRRPDPHRRHPQLEPVQAPVPQDDPARHPRLGEGFGPGVHDPLLPRAHVLRREPQSLRASSPGGLQHPILRHGCSEAPEVVPADHLEVRVRPLLLQPDDVRVPAGFGVDDEAVERAVALLGILLEDRVRPRRSDLVVVAREERDDVAGFEARARCGLEHDLRGRGRDAGYPPPPRRDASRDRAPAGGGDDRDEHQMEVPAEVAKIVIGAGGNSIKDLQDRTGAHVMIYKPQPGARESGYRPVVIRGSRRAVDLATDELRAVVRDYEDGLVGGKAGRDRGHDRGGFGDRYGGGYERDAPRGGSGGGRHDRYDDRGPPPSRGGGGYDDRRGSFPPFGGDEADHVQERVECPIENRGIVIGKNGKQVQRIERDTGAKISSQGDEPFLLIRGTPTSVRNARSQISSILDAADMPPLPPPPPEGASHALEVHVERDHIGKVMGYGGMTIKRAQADTRCVMKWDKENQRIQLWGSPEVVEAGRRRIEDLVEQAKVDISKELADATTVEVPTRGHTGFIIGGGGQKVKRMERETGARLRMDDRAQIMVITGRSAAVEKAARMVEDAVERAEAIERGEPPVGQGGDDRYRDDFRR
mmetsp:Transcript_2353/g.9539  ORF Transcript_2353/g.9539 Transcript_2353/m.9539 type:complete len:611 (-) Transcript_2353:45-1877(-)